MSAFSEARRCPKCGNLCTPRDIRNYKMCKYCYVKESDNE